MNDNNNVRRYYVYHWINDDTNLPFYVGKGTDRRYKRVGPNIRNPWFMNMINKHPCHPEIIIDNLTEEEAFAAEIETENKYRKLGYTLCNIIPCGSAPPHGFGPDNNNYGNYWSEDKKKEISEKMRETKCHAGARNGRCKKCMRVEDGKIYDYQTEAAHELGLKSLQSIAICLKFPYRTAKGYHFVEENMFEKLNTEEKRKEYLDSIIEHSRLAS